MLKDFASPPRIWLRYIDDTFVVLKKTEVVSFHKFINIIEESIKFTVEQEVDNAIPFLDVLIICNNGQLTTKAYRKPTHTTRYLNFNSSLNFSQKVGLVKTLLQIIKIRPMKLNLFFLINILRLLYLLKFYLPVILPEEQMDFKLSNIPGNSVYINITIDLKKPLQDF